MNVYVVEIGQWEDKHLAGIFDSMEAVLLSFPNEKLISNGYTGMDECWSNNLSYDDAMDVYIVKVETL